MTKIIDNSIQYVDSQNDTVGDSIKEIESSVSYKLNDTTENLTLNAPCDYEIKSI